MFSDQSRHCPNIPLITLELVSAEVKPSHYAWKHRYRAGWRTAAGRLLFSYAPQKCDGLVLALTTGASQTDRTGMMRFSPLKCNSPGPLNCVSAVRFIKSCSYFTAPLWVARSGQTELSTQPATRVPPTFRKTISPLPHPWKMAAGSCEHPRGRSLSSVYDVVVN